MSVDDEKTRTGEERGQETADDQTSRALGDTSSDQNQSKEWNGEKKDGFAAVALLERCGEDTTEDDTKSKSGVRNGSQLGSKVKLSYCKRVCEGIHGKSESVAESHGTCDDMLADVHGNYNGAKTYRQGQC